jgi:hypothetical protein
VTIANSTLLFAGPFVNEHNIMIEGNHIGDTARVTSGCCPVVFNNGDHNQVVANILDGGYPGVCSVCGQDDGILLWNESADVIRDNDISNVFDAGIEGVNVVTGSTIANNRITNAITAGIASYWCTHWENDTIVGNIASATPEVLTFFYNAGGAKCQGFGPVATGFFGGNTIANNVLLNRTGSDPLGIFLDFATNSPAVGVNMLRGNDVGAAGITTLPAAAFVDGGGNTCMAVGSFRC